MTLTDSSNKCFILLNRLSCENIDIINNNGRIFNSEYPIKGVNSRKGIYFNVGVLVK